MADPTTFVASCAGSNIPTQSDTQLHANSSLSKLQAATICAVITLMLYAILIQKDNKTHIPIVNNPLGRLGTAFSRISWAFRSRSILDYGFRKFAGDTYMLARGDTNLIVLPASFIPELNRLPSSLLDSREYHSSSMLGYLTELDIIRKSTHHVKVLMSRVSPALPRLLDGISKRTSASVVRLFPQQTTSWAVVKPLDLIAHCVTEGLVLAMYGTPICDNPELVQLVFEHTRDVFATVMYMRFFPAVLQPLLVWLCPTRWRLRRSWRRLEELVAPRLETLKRREHEDAEPDLLSWMVKDGRTVEERDPQILAKLAASVAAGGFTAPRTLCSRGDLGKNQVIDGNWDQAAYNSLDKLDSAMKETSRLAPGSLLVYSRVLQADHTLSNGIQLRKGQFVTISSHTRAMDPVMFENPKEYHGLRYYKGDLQRHRARPFRDIDGDILSWGAGRGACPGRFIANLLGKFYSSSF
ncbi:cytochrome P450 [Apiospora kogelbergensis]|uniref:cytochrome P450 n=1 Tax=Apiospora kogelbergensis TaxID=1337665 RepID=UPI0031305FCF